VSEVVGVGLLFGGLLLLVAGLIWLIVRSCRSRGFLLASLLVLTTPVGPLIYGLIHFRKCLRPLVLILAGLLTGALPFAFSHGLELLMGLGERERIIAGERHLVLTGWDRPDYSILNSRTDVVVLEMANPNVDDETLKLLLPLTNLRELTLNDSLISDAGLQLLRQLPALESLRIARTKITKDGIVEFLADPPAKLKELDVSGNSIPASALRKWKNQEPEIRRYVN
jgi:hypothetical protein